MVLAGLNVVVVGGATGVCAATLPFARTGASVTLVERSGTEGDSLRDRMLFPVANRFAWQKAMALVLQKPTETPLALGSS